jgi:hypothetical protein
MVAAMRSNNIPDLTELLQVIKALEDADYWGHGPPPSSRKRSKGDPVFDTPPGEFGDFDQTYDGPPPPYSKSKAKSKSKSTSTSNSTSKSKAASTSKSASKSKSKGKDKDYRLVCESKYLPYSRVSLRPTDPPYPATHFDSAFKTFSSAPARGRGDTAMTFVNGLATGLKGGAVITGIPYIHPIASLLLLTVNIRDVSVRVLT